MNPQKKKKSGHENRQLAKEKDTKENMLLKKIPSLNKYFQVLPSGSLDSNKNEEEEFVAKQIKKIEDGIQNLELLDTDHSVY